MNTLRTLAAMITHFKAAAELRTMVSEAESTHRPVQPTAGKLLTSESLSDPPKTGGRF